MSQVFLFRFSHCSSVKSPNNFEREDQLFNRVKFIRSHSQSALIFGKPYSDVTESELNDRVTKILKKMEEKGISKIYQCQYMQSVMLSVIVECRVYDLRLTKLLVSMLLNEWTRTLPWLPALLLYWPLQIETLSE